MAARGQVLHVILELQRVQYHNSARLIVTRELSPWLSPG
jgi:hypothetical protein